MPSSARPCLALLAFLAAPLGAQDWQDGRDVPLLERAVAQRIGRDADTLLTGWRAVASGVVRFAAVVDHGGIPIERVIRADELRVEVYGEAPNRSKQVITAWRDTVFQPAPITYHRDHLGIVASDFGPAIRLGNGDEVRDVPHPLSVAGLAGYRFRLGDTLAIQGGDAVVRVQVVDVRPADPAAPGTVGTMYLDIARGTLIRFRFTFTAASYRDPTVAEITVSLENALYEGVRWLPWRQAIVIRRAEPLLALPLETVIRADWTIDDYSLGVSHPAGRFAGEAVGGLHAPGGAAEWGPPLVQRLEGLPGTTTDLRALRSLATTLAPGSRLDGLPSVRFLGAQGLSSLLRVNRVQGITPGLGARWIPAPGWQVQTHAAIGTADGRLTAGVEVARTFGSLAASLEASRDVRDVDPGSFGSLVGNSLTTLVGGDDAGDWLLLDRIRAGVARHGTEGVHWSVSAGLERPRGLSRRFSGPGRVDRPNPDLGAGTALVWRGRLAARPAAGGTGWSLEAEAGSGDLDWLRLEGTLRAAAGPLRLLATGGAATTGLPGYRSLVAGGRGTLVGVPGRVIGGRRLVRVEVARPVPVAIPLPAGPGLARTALVSRVVPYLAAAVAGGTIGELPWRGSGEVETVLGLRLDLWGPLLRLDLGWAPSRHRMGFSVDAHPDWWPLL